MLSARLVKMIEDHAEHLTQGVLDQFRTHPLTTAYRRFSDRELHTRVYDVYRNLSHWIGEKAEDAVAATYSELGRTRRRENIPLAQVVEALTLTKYHLRAYVRDCGLVGSAVELYQEQELHRLVEIFFDSAIYHTVRGYEEDGWATEPVAEEASAAASTSGRPFRRLRSRS
jgi:hypothetical protein